MITKSLVAIKHESGIDITEMNNISSLHDDFDKIESNVLDALETVDLGSYEITLTTKEDEIQCVKPISVSN
ncbi:hypothetical protein VmeM32_00055 [Vibrio phage vB_VmeM-32]|nr:hypothetical protein VmeM32_00055 [Vibrio phage vB_VmeM-32]